MWYLLSIKTQVLQQHGDGRSTPLEGSISEKSAWATDCWRSFRKSSTNQSYGLSSGFNDSGADKFGYGLLTYSRTLLTHVFVTSGTTFFDYTALRSLCISKTEPLMCGDNSLYQSGCLGIAICIVTTCFQWQNIWKLCCHFVKEDCVSTISRSKHGVRQTHTHIYIILLVCTHTYIYNENNKLSCIFQ